MSVTSPAGAPLAWSVSGLLLAVSDALAARFGAVTVRGELSGFSRAASGHCYFSLKDGTGAPALIRCAMFRRAASLVDFSPADGQQVEARGRLALYEARGELQLVVESLQRVGAGTLYEEFLRLRARLESQGLFDAARKRALVRHPRAVGVVTSLGAAALHDVLTALARRCPQVEVVVYPALVQGVEAPASLVRALEQAGSRREVDALLLVRGGGSLEDLWSFNDERVVRAVVACPIPVVCGVGHETDITLCDLAADLRAPTPTAAAELVAPARAELEAAWRRLAQRLQQSIRGRLDHAEQRLDLLGSRAGKPVGRLATARERLQAWSLRVEGAVRRRLEREGELHDVRRQRLGQAIALAGDRQRRRLELAAARLASVDPRGVLRRGYAWLEDGQGQPVCSVRSVQPGDEVRAVLADGQVQARVQAVLPVADEPASP